MVFHLILNYNNKILVSDIVSLKNAFSKDYVPAEYKKNFSSKDNIIKSNCLIFDIDNKHTEDESKWIRKQDIINTFKYVTFFIHCSKNHMKVKNGEKLDLKHILVS